MQPAATHIKCRCQNWRFYQVPKKKLKKEGCLASSFIVFSLLLSWALFGGESGFVGFLGCCWFYGLFFNFCMLKF
jgi:hypothetical protein